MLPTSLQPTHTDSFCQLALHRSTASLVGIGGSGWIRTTSVSCVTGLQPASFTIWIPTHIARLSGLSPVFPAVIALPTEFRTAAVSCGLCDDIFERVRICTSHVSIMWLVPRRTCAFGAEHTFMRLLLRFSLLYNPVPLYHPMWNTGCLFRHRSAVFPAVRPISCVL